MRLKEIPLNNQPRVRLKSVGASNLSDAELLALILRQGTNKENVIDMSNKLISKFGLSKLTNCNFKELKSVNGIGDAKASQIIALFEFVKRVKVNNISRIIKGPKDVFNLLNPKMRDYDKEHFIILMLDTKNNVINEEVVSIGILNASLVHPREIFKNAIKESASGIILVHNHPSGDSSPSSEDLEITKRLIKVGEIIGISVLDHVIIGSDTYWSYTNNN